MRIVKHAAGLPGVRVKGVHCHIGSQIFELEPFKLAVSVMMRFLKDVSAESGITIDELNLGGGFGIRYIASNDPPELSEAAHIIAQEVKKNAEELGLEPPFLVLEPGRSVVAPAGVTVYTVGSVKEIPGIRTYVSVDGGMTDNPRYALYGSVYEAVLPERPFDDRTKEATIAGRCCESGDLIAKDIMLPEVKAGEYLAVLATGAYNYSMASNYNRVPRPAVVMVSGGKAKLAVRRETYEDLIRNDIL
jgi:diaminopimelate decarboxylase